MTEFTCPTPILENKIILLSHGSGGKLTHDLIEKIFLPNFLNDELSKLHDGAILNLQANKIAFTTDSFVVNPIFFPGGNIGDLAVNGTVNDILMCGAKPIVISCAFIIEEGFLISDLEKIVKSISDASKIANVKIVTGDTKVVEKGKGDKIFINTTGIGIVENEIGIDRIKIGDKIILSGTIADHGIAIMSSREGLSFESEIQSDTCALNEIVQSIFDVSKTISFLRDPTRGGIATTLNEIASQSNYGIMLYENEIPIREDVKAACEILGLDALYVANEGKFICIVSNEDAEKVLDKIQNHPLGKNAKIIGEITSENRGYVVLKSKIGGMRFIDMLVGEQLPRIC